MLIEERFCEILKIVEEKRTVTVQELTEILNTSESTIRRDLTVLHNNGQLIKVHGGATAIDMSFSMIDHEVAIRQDLNTEEKRRIAKYATDLIKPGDFIYLDAGTSTGYIIDYLNEKDITVVTNATVHAKRLAGKGIKTYILGGEFKAATEAIVGIETTNALKKYNFMKGFFGANGVSPKNGFTTPDPSEAMVKKTAMSQTREKYVLCDVSKFRQVSPVTFAEFDEATIITSILEDDKLKNYNNILEVGKG